MVYIIVTDVHYGYNDLHYVTPIYIIVTDVHYCYTDVHYCYRCTLLSQMHIIVTDVHYGAVTDKKHI